MLDKNAKMKVFSKYEIKKIEFHKKNIEEIKASRLF